MTSQRPKRLFLSPPHLGSDEVGFVREAFESNYIAPLGPMVDAFEREFAKYVGITHCVALASGTAGIHLALRELGVGPGDHVLASTMTFIGSVTPATFLGASLGFVDSERGSWNIDLGLLAEELEDCAQHGKLPKAVIATDIYGQCCDIESLRRICDRYEIPVIADSAEAMGAFRKVESEGQTNTKLGAPASQLSTDETVNSVGMRHAGYGANAAVFSFNGNKIMTTGGGGMLASDNEHLVEHARKLSQQAREPAPHYEHTEIGYNYRLSNILAAIGRGQLRVLDQRVAAKRRIFEHYRLLLADLPGVTFMPETPCSRCNRWLTVILINRAEFGSTGDRVRLALEAENIESRNVWKPMHLQPVFRGFRVRGGDVSEHLFRDGLCLPSGTAMGDADVERVARIVIRCLGTSTAP